MREVRAAALECLIGYATTETEFTVPGLCTLLGYPPSSREARAVRSVVDKMCQPHDMGVGSNWYRVIEWTGMDSEGRKRFRVKDRDGLSSELRTQLNYDEDQYVRTTSANLPPVQLVGRVHHLLRWKHWMVEREREDLADTLDVLADELHETADGYRA